MILYNIVTEDIPNRAKKIIANSNVIENHLSDIEKQNIHNEHKLSGIQNDLSDIRVDLIKLKSQVNYFENRFIEFEGKIKSESNPCRQDEM